MDLSTAIAALEALKETYGGDVKLSSLHKSVDGASVDSVENESLISWIGSSYNTRRRADENRV